jgi:dethiobiotin synthetase
VAALFVTATGTDIGKTFVTAGLIAALRRRGRAVSAIKPVMTGFSPDGADSSDAAILLRALGRPVTVDTLAEISPWRFAAPLAPDLAAAREGRTLEFAALVAFCRAATGSGADPLLIEGVGGVMVPLDDRHTVLDWMTALHLPVLLVAGSYLGTISHTLTAMDVLLRHDLATVAIVISESAGSTVPLDATVASIARFATPIPVLGLPQLATWSAQHPVFDRLAGLL